MSFAPTPASEPTSGTSAKADPWIRILAALEKKANRQSFNQWLKPTIFSHISDRVIVVRVPTVECQTAVYRYANLIDEALEVLDLDFDDVKFVTPEEDPTFVRPRDDGGYPPAPARPNGTHSGTENHARPAERTREKAAPSRPDNTPALAGANNPAPSTSQRRFDWNGAEQLIPRYTFDAFVIGNGNQFARAAAQAVAEKPSKAYNPLFVYSGPGMGKTHLMHAIGHEMKRRQPQASICYATSETFTNEMINSIRYDKMTSFRDKFRSVDLLLIDDIQFIVSKERTCEEFFHTFNALHESMKQIVIASDRPPKELAEIEDRLRSRFEWGLIADISAARSRNQGRHPAEEGRERSRRPPHRGRALHRVECQDQRPRTRRCPHAPHRLVRHARRVEITLAHRAAMPEAVHRYPGPQDHHRSHSARRGRRIRHARLRAQGRRTTRAPSSSPARSPCSWPSR